jgi:hypothetical protein
MGEWDVVGREFSIIRLMLPPDPAPHSGAPSEEGASRPEAIASIADREIEAQIRLEEAKIKNTNLILANQAFAQDTDERKNYARRFLYIAWAWVAVIALVLIMQGSCSQGCGPVRFQLSDPVLLAAIGSTTANIFGILYVVANYLFPKK